MDQVRSPELRDTFNLLKFKVFTTLSYLEAKFANYFSHVRSLDKGNSLDKTKSPHLDYVRNLKFRPGNESKIWIR